MTVRYVSGSDRNMRPEPHCIAGLCSNILLGEKLPVIINFHQKIINPLLLVGAKEESFKSDYR